MVFNFDPPVFDMPAENVNSLLTMGGGLKALPVLLHDVGPFRDIALSQFNKLISIALIPFLLSLKKKKKKVS